MNRGLAPRELLRYRQEAAVAVTGRRAFLERGLLRTGREDVRAARRERAPRREGEQRRRQARDGREAVGLGSIDARDRAQQAPRVRVLRVPEQLALRAVLDHAARSEEHTSELQSPDHLVCRLLLEQQKKHTQQQILVKKKTTKKQ